jgi:hypothetical protein
MFWGRGLTQIAADLKNLKISVHLCPESSS